METLAKRKCEHCERVYTRLLAYVKYHGAKYCSRKCFSLSRRTNLTASQKKEKKRLYDIEYRRKQGKLLLAKRRESYRRNIETYRVYQRQRRESGVQKRYMRKYLKNYWTTEKKKDKAAYDRVFRAKKKFGPFWESHLLLLKINKEVLKRASKYECRLARGYYNKAQIRKRQWLRNNSTLAL